MAKGESIFAQLGSWVVRHWAIAIGLWIGLTILSLTLSPALEKSLQGAGMTYEGGEARQTELQLQKELQISPDPLTVVFQSPSTQFWPVIENLLNQIQAVPGVRSVMSAAENPEYLSGDGRTQYAVVNLQQSGTDSIPTIDRIEHLLEQNAAKEVKTWVSGKAVVDREAQRISKADLARAELLALPLTLVALLFIFGSVIAASLPIAMGVLSVSATFGLLYFVAQQMPMSVLALNFTSMLGLGLGIDYALLIVNRFREELQTHPVQQAVVRTVDTAGRAVFFSGMIVCISLVCLLLFPIDLLRSIGIAGALVVLLSVAVALTVLPALLMLIGHRINWGSQWIRPISFNGNFWSAIAHQVTRHSVLAIVSVFAVISFLTAPFLNAHFGLGDASILPRTSLARQAIETVQQTLGMGETSPILLMIQTQTLGDKLLTQPNIIEIYQLLDRLQSDRRIARINSIFTLDSKLSLKDYQQLYSAPKNLLPPKLAAAVQTLSNHSTTLAIVTSREESHHEDAHRLVQDLRKISLKGLTVKVGGQAASEIDTLQEVAHRFPLILAATMTVTFMVLTLLFQSVILPLKAIAMNVLSIGASFGALVFVFQEGHLKEWLHFDPLGYLDILLPLVLFCVVFGLSMDYEVFLLARIKEIYDRTGNNTQSVVEGLECTGGMITSAALLMIIVTGAFALTNIIFMKALGLGIALAILLDASLIRVILVPAAMHLMGEWNWWSPRFMKLDRIQVKVDEW
jgi:putative drug exporter of the RND superfamily